jgi:hypothetical protein
MVILYSLPGSKVDVVKLYEVDDVELTRVNDGAELSESNCVA